MPKFTGSPLLAAAQRDSAVLTSGFMRRSRGAAPLQAAELQGDRGIRGHLIRQRQNRCFMGLMHPLITSYRLMLRIVAELIAHVRGDARLGGGSDGSRTEVAARAMAKRLKAGVRMVEAYLRRVIIMMALEMEPTLVDTRKPLLKRPDHHKSFYQPIRFTVLDESYSAYTSAVHTRLEAARISRKQGRRRPKRPVNLGRLHHRLDLLARIAANPIVCARRFATHLARSREGVIVAPDLHYKPPGYLRRYWTTEPSMTFDLMGYEILQQSKARPPPQAPIQTRGPRITWL